MIICLLGPTASGKTPLAIELVQRFPMEIISVDSAMVYREMNIGTAKPDADILKIAPHRLIDICDPAEAYSAGRFRDDALREINTIIKQGKIPLMVGGTMLYFRILLQGIADLPAANQQVRDELATRATEEGWPALHAELAAIDKESAARIHPNDAQRIQRALEVFQLTGQTITALQQNTSPLVTDQVVSFALAPAERRVLHERIAARFELMLQQGFLAEVQALYDRGDLSPSLPSIRSVGYRQLWQHVAGLESFDEACQKAVFATRQLAKRQITWLRTWPELTWLETGKMDDAIRTIGSVAKG